MNSCYAYIRVSTVKQGEGVSLEAQREAISAYAKNRGLTITMWFEEKETAAKRGRPVFDSMVKELSQGKAGGLIVHKIDRSARNIADWAKIGELADSGIRIHFATETLDFTSRGGRLTADIQAVIAADYIRNLKEETKKGLYGRLKQGIYPFKAPPGYIDNGPGKAKTIDPVKGPKVKALFEAYARGEESLSSLVQLAKKFQLTSNTGQPLCRTSIETMLANPFYIGLMKVKKTGQVFQGTHRSLISHRLFKQVQAQKAQKGVKKKTKRFFAYRSLFRCAFCNNTMIPERQRGHVYYRCHTKKCPTNTLREDALEFVLHEVFQHAQIDDKQVQAFEEELKRRLTKKQNPLYKATLPRIEARIDRLTDALADGIITDAVYTKKLEELEIKRSEVIEKQKELDNTEKQTRFVAQFLEHCKSLASTYEMANSCEKAQMVRNAFSNLLIKDKNLYFTSRNWLMTEQNCKGVLECCHPHTKNRSTSKLQKPVLPEMEDFSDFYCQEFVRTLEDIRSRKKTLNSKAV